MTPKAVFVSIIPLTARVRRDWLVDALRERGVDVEFLDASPLWGLAGSEKAPAPRPWERRVASFDALDERLAAPENAHAWFVLLTVDGDPRNERPLRTLARLGRRTCAFRWGLLPEAAPNPLRRAARRLLSPLTLSSRLRAKARERVARALGLIKPLDIVFAAGRAARRSHPPARRLVPINMCDFENFRDLDSGAAPPVEGRCAVFLDNNQPFNADLDFCGLPRLDPGRYFRSLNRFFGLLERRLGLRVAVAAHPKSEYAASLFEGRPLIKGRTPRLVKDAELVLGHHSTAFGYAAAGRKPALFLYTDDMARLYPDERIAPMRAFAEYLNAPLLNVDRVDAPERIELRPADPARCELYLREFLATEDTEKRRNADIVFDALFVP